MSWTMIWQTAKMVYTMAIAGWFFLMINKYQNTMYALESCLVTAIYWGLSVYFPMTTLIIEATCCAFVFWFVIFNYHFSKSVLIEWVSTTWEDNRAKFRNIRIARLQDAKDLHSHPTAAAIRTTMNWAIDDYVRRCDRKLYSVAMSEADKRAGHRGCHYHIQGKDLSYRMQDDLLLDDDVVKMSDTGYYLDLPRWMDGHEIVLYEIVPNRVACGVADATYSFNAQNCLVERVNGDAQYEHALWDFSTDHLLVHRWWGTYEYLVEKICHPEYPEYRIIGLFPRRFVWAPISWLVSGTTLKRRQVVHGDWARIDSVANDHQNRGVRYSSIGKVGMTNDALLPTELLNSLITRAGFVKHFDLGSVEMYLEPEWKDPRYVWLRKHVQSLKSVATVVTDYIRDACNIKDVDFVSNPDNRFTFVPLNKEFRPLTSDIQGVMRNLTPTGREPLLAGSVSPAKGRATEQSAIDERLTRVRNDVAPPEKYYRWGDEFVEHLVPDSRKHTGVPTSEDTLFEKQCRPTQVSILAKMMTWFKCQKLYNKAFVKAEAYSGVNAPRMISTLPASLKGEYSLYLYSFSENVLYRQDWYAFGHSPSELEAMVHVKARDATTVVATDFSRFDGRISYFFRWLEGRVLQRYFAPRYARRVLDLHTQQLRLCGVTRGGIRYAAGPHRLSGSPETAAFNSIDNAYVQYCTYRAMGHGPEQSWMKLGLYGGDDGMSFDASQEVAEQVARDLGMKLTLETLPRGSVIPFLGRWWFGAWTGPATSSADIPRQVSKLHLSADHLNTLAVIHQRKADGLWFSDRDTPILGEWAKAVNRLNGNPDSHDRSEANWLVREEGVLRQPDRSVILKYLLSKPGWSLDAVEKIIDVCHAARTHEELYPEGSINGMRGTKAKISAIVGGTIVGDRQGGELNPGGTPTPTTQASLGKRGGGSSKPTKPDRKPRDRRANHVAPIGSPLGIKSGRPGKLPEGQTRSTVAPA